MRIIKPDVGEWERREAPTRPLAAIPAAELAAELRRRERRVQMLVRRYETLMGRAAKLTLLSTRSAICVFDALNSQTVPYDQPGR